MVLRRNMVPVIMLAHMFHPIDKRLERNSHEAGEMLDRQDEHDYEYRAENEERGKDIEDRTDEFSVGNTGEDGPSEIIDVSVTGGVLHSVQGESHLA